MSFVSVSFFFFYLLVLTLRFSIGREKQGKLYFVSLILLSIVFYSWEIPQYIILILITCLINYYAAIQIYQTPSRNKRLRQAILTVSLLCNLGILGIFKYTGFFFDIFAFLGHPLVTEETHSFWGTIVLPIGISFYTFQSMSYTIDVYRGQFKPVPFSRFFLYVAFFPQLVAGPIVRAKQFIYQLNRRRKIRAKVFFEGGYLIVRGLFLKIVVADNLAMIINEHWQVVAAPNAPIIMSLSLTFFFSCQLLCDFMGYTDIARGVAYQLGFRLPINFNAPYIANSFSGFWKRWHISLSQWMRDYVYISLGGNSKGKCLTPLNLLIVMVVAGLWHGASMNFVLWGGIHGLAICLERVFGISGWIRDFEKGRIRMNGSQSARAFIWFVVVQTTWLVGMAVFRSGSGSESLIVLGNLYHGIFSSFDAPGLEPKVIAALQLGWVFTIPVFLLHARAFITEWAAVPVINLYERSVYVGVMLFCLVSLYATNQPFIYFQF